MNVPVKPSISAEELERRRTVLEKIHTANRLEGLAPSKEVWAIFELWASGQISDEERQARAFAQLEAEAAACDKEPEEVSG